MLGKVSEARLELLYGPLADAVRNMAVLLESEIPFIVTQGLRSWSEQDALYAQGRTTPGAIVTNVAGGRSWHNFGLAVDLAPDDPTKPGFQIDWNAAHPQWKRLEQVGISVGLFSGSLFRSFPDAPHFQLTGRFGLTPNDEVRQLFRDGGMAAVWAEVTGK